MKASKKVALFWEKIKNKGKKKISWVLQPTCILPGISLSTERGYSTGHTNTMLSML